MSWRLIESTWEVIINIINGLFTYSNTNNSEITDTVDSGILDSGVTDTHTHRESDRDRDRETDTLSVLRRRKKANCIVELYPSRQRAQESSICATHTPPSYESPVCPSGKL